MLVLVTANRDPVGAVKQDVGGHEVRVGKSEPGSSACPSLLPELHHSGPQRKSEEGFGECVQYRHTRRSTEIIFTRSGTAERHPKAPRTRFPAVKKAA
jgi:hypothetical protein